MSDALTELIMDNIKSFIGTAEVYVGPGRTNTNGTIKVRDLGDVASEIDYTIGVVENQATFRNAEKKDQQISVKGYRLEDLAIMNPVNLVETLGEEAFKGKTIIVGKSFAEKEGFVLGDYMKLKYSEDDVKRFKIVGIVEDKGSLKDPGLW